MGVLHDFQQTLDLDLSDSLQSWTAYEGLAVKNVQKMADLVGVVSEAVDDIIRRSEVDCVVGSNGTDLIL